MVRLSEAARDERAEERRGQILRAALVVFSQKGFHGATIREIASAAGLAEGTIYLYFPSKQEVLRGVFALIAEEASAAPNGSGLANGDDESFLRGLLESRITSLSNYAAFLRLSVHEADLHESLRQEFFARLCEPFVARLETYLQGRIAEGVFRPVKTELTAAICFRMLMSHIMVQHVLDVDASAARHADEDYVGAMVSLILYGLVARPTSAGPRQAL
ncbi:MAG TPA: helix-turn-helix domain-containing protein [bacterium]|nr:helix-turn-helix domain-containing protein [bacterium]